MAKQNIRKKRKKQSEPTGLKKPRVGRPPEVDRRSARLQARAAKKKRQGLITYVAVGFLLLAAAVLILWSDQEAPEVSAERLSNNPTLGAADAPVTLTEFGDFTCSACRSWHLAGIVNQLLVQYDGELKVEWRDFPIITANSPKAAEAGQCAYDQGRFWDFLDRVYSEPGSAYTNARVTDLRRYADDIGLDTGRFNECLDNKDHQATVQFDLDFSKNLGLRGTPSFSVNGTPVIGGNPELIIQAINSELSRNN